jgi:hypothetical protein
MNAKIKSLLLPFYFGSIADSERTLIERELLLDSETLVDYLDLKRSIEAAEHFPLAPSASLFSKLQEIIKPKRRFFISLSLGAVAAGVLLIFFVLKPKTIDPKNIDQAPEEILFNLRDELPANSNVL